MVSVGMKSCVLTVFVVNLSSCVVSSLFIHLGAEERCFREDIPEEEALLGSYRAQLFDQRSSEYLPTSPGRGVLLSVKDPDNELVLSQPSKSEGTFRLRSLKMGEYQICLRPDLEVPPPAGHLLAVHLDVRVGERTNNYTRLASQERLTQLQLRVRQLMEQVDQIQREQNYQRAKSKHFLEVSHSTNMWIFWWPVARSLYVVALIIWHTKSW